MDYVWILALGGDALGGVFVHIVKTVEFSSVQFSSV